MAACTYMYTCTYVHCKLFTSTMCILSYTFMCVYVSVSFYFVFSFPLLCPTPPTIATPITAPPTPQVLSSFSAVGSKDIPAAASPFLSCEINEEKLVKELINDCYHHHRRAFFGSLPSETCKLTINQPGWLHGEGVGNYITCACMCALIS